LLPKFIPVISQPFSFVLNYNQDIEDKLKQQTVTESSECVTDLDKQSEMIIFELVEYDDF